MKRDPDAEFVVQKLTRKGISEILNELIENEGMDVPPFSPDDDRLTDEVCQAMAGASYEAICEVDEVVDREYEGHVNVLELYFG